MVSSFQLLGNISLYDYTAIDPFSLDAPLSGFQLLSVVIVSATAYKHFGMRLLVSTCTFLSGVYLGVELLGHRICINAASVDSRQQSAGVRLLYQLTRQCIRATVVPHLHRHLYCQFLILSHSGGSVGLVPCAFIVLPFPAN